MLEVRSVSLRNKCEFNRFIEIVTLCLYMLTEISSHSGCCCCARILIAARAASFNGNSRVQCCVRLLFRVGCDVSTVVFGNRVCIVTNRLPPTHFFRRTTWGVPVIVIKISFAMNYPATVASHRPSMTNESVQDVSANLLSPMRK